MTVFLSRPICSRSLALSVFKVVTWTFTVSGLHMAPTPAEAVSTVSSDGPKSIFQDFFGAKAVAMLLDFCSTECPWEKMMSSCLSVRYGWLEVSDVMLSVLRLKRSWCECLHPVTQHCQESRFLWLLLLAGLSPHFSSSCSRVVRSRCCLEALTVLSLRAGDLVRVPGV